jgi:hypothetical protein
MGTRPLPSDLAQARRRFQVWRAQRPAGSRVPQGLWRLAVRLVSRHGVSRTAGALGVDYYTLKERAEAAAVPHTPSGGPAFIELPAPAGVSKQCLFELDNSAGVRLRVQLLGYDATEIETVAHSLWKAE